MKRTPQAVAPLLLAAFLTAACSNNSAGTGTPTTGGSAVGVGQAVKFAQCMRQNGVSNFPDPDASGQFTIDAIANGSGIDTSSAAFMQALSACKSLEPPGFTGTTRSAGQQEAALRFAQCIRDNGVADFPDPTPGGPLVDTNRIPSAATPGGMSLLRAAMQKCRSFASSAGVAAGK